MQRYIWPHFREREIARERKVPKERGCNHHITNDEFFKNSSSGSYGFLWDIFIHSYPNHLWLSPSKGNKNEKK